MSRGADHFVFETDRPPGKATRYSYIEPGDAEVLENSWLLIRDSKTGMGRVRRWSPSAIDAKKGDAQLPLGRRLVREAWALEWVGVAPGTEGMTGRRVMVLRTLHRGNETEYWQYDPAERVGRHDFASLSKLHHLGVEVVSAKLADDAEESTLVVRASPVERATRAALGAALGPGLYVFNDGLRVLFEKNTSCAMSVNGPCECSDYLETTAELQGEEKRFRDAAAGIRALGHGFRWNGGLLTVSR